MDLLEEAHYDLVLPEDRDGALLPTAVAYTPGGLWLVEESAARLLRWDARSESIERVVGRSGGGPGEFRRPVEIVASQHGIGVWDIGASTVTHLDQQGELVRVVHLPGMYPKVVPLPDGRVVAWSLASERELPDLFELDGSVGSLRLGAQPPTPATPDRQSRDASPQPACFFAGHAGTRLILGDCEIPDVTIFGEDGTRLATWSVAAARIETTEGDLSRLRASFLSTMRRSGLPDSVAQSVADRSVEAYAIQRPYSKVALVPTSRILLLLEQKPAELEPQSVRIHAFSPGGAYLGPISLPHPVQDWVATGDSLYVLTTSPEFKHARIIRYRVEVRAEVGDLDDILGISSIWGSG